MVLAALADAAGPRVGHRRTQNALPIDAVMPEKPVVFGGEKCLDEFGRQLVVAHRDAPLLADRGNQTAVARVDPQRHLQLDFAQAVDVRQRRLQIDISTDIGERDQRNPAGQHYTNAGYEN